VANPDHGAGSPGALASVVVQARCFASDLRYDTSPMTWLTPVNIAFTFVNVMMRAG